MSAPTGPDRPAIDTDSQDWWAAVQNGTLTVNACRACGRNSLYARPFCPHCWSEEVALVPASGRARLYTWTEIHQNAAPFDAVPYVLAMVDLEEGPRLMTVLDGCTAAELHAEMDLVVAFREGADGFVIPVFQPTSR